MGINHSNTYERLLAMHFEIDPKPIPDPQYINGKIGECHRLIDEIEKFAIESNQELSVHQKALNDATALYENAKEGLLSSPEVKDLPSIKDREARANSKLRSELQNIREYQNAVSSCTNLLRAINLKQRNMNRANSDIKMQLRMMEAQIKIGTPMMGDAAARSLMAELSRGISNDSILGEAETSVTTTQVMDPTSPVDISRVLQDAPAEIVGPDVDGEEEEESEEERDRFGLIDPTEKVFEEPGEDSVRDAEAETQEIDLDQIIDGTAPKPKPNLDQIIEKTPVQEPATLTQKGGAIQQETQRTEEPASSPKAGQQKTEGGGIDLDSLLSQFK